MDEEKFELFYRLPDAEKHVPLPTALDYLFWMIENLEQRNKELERRVAQLENKLTTLQTL